MTIRQDLLRALQYGKSDYYRAIQAQPTYQKELERVRKDYNERTWIDFSGFFPKFTTEEFEKRRQDYQKKYGTTVNIPGFGDVIHITPKARISAEERAAHIYALKRGLPSPLTYEQQQTLKYKKFRFLKALASATPAWLKTYGSVATTLDNVEDALVTIVVLGRIAVRIAPRLMGKLVSGLGWVLLGSDILNAVNLASYLTLTKRGCKGHPESLAEKNPFHAKAAANRATKLKRAIPTFGEILEVLQTTDQLFGVGVCLGGLMGLVWDTASTAFNPNYWKQLGGVLANGNINEISNYLARAALNDYNAIKKGLQEQFTELRDESFRLSSQYFRLQESVHDWAMKKSKEFWSWITTPPPQNFDWFSNSLEGSMIMSTGKDDFLKEDHTKAFMMLNSAITGLMPWWIENDPLNNFKDIRNFLFRAPSPKDPTTQDMLNEYHPKWENTVLWPHLNKEYATIEEIAFTYAPMIKDSFQTYCLKYKHDYEAMIAAQQAVEFTKNVIKAFDDNWEVKLGMSPWWAAAEDMIDNIYLVPLDTPQELTEALYKYIEDYDRQYGKGPSIREIAAKGTALGIKWERSFPATAFGTAAEIFPEWREIQERLPELYVVD